VVMYFCGFITRAQSPASPASKVAAKCIFAVSNMMLFTRATRFYAGSTTLGPKVCVCVCVCVCVWMDGWMDGWMNAYVRVSLCRVRTGGVVVG
jgi:hypothetical protein